MLHFDHFLYALGSHLTAPVDLWGPVANEDPEKADVLGIARGTKQGGIALLLKRFKRRIARRARASSVLVVGHRWRDSRYPRVLIILMHFRLCGTLLRRRRHTRLLFDLLHASFSFTI